MSTATVHSMRQRGVAIPFARGQELPGDLGVPEGAEAAVLFVHGGGSSRHSPRNLRIARSLREAGLATLLFDLIPEGEADERRKMFEIELQASRVRAAVAWLNHDPETRDLRLGGFGAGTGAAALLKMASRRPAVVEAVVCRGGWVDLARRDLLFITAPTLLIVGALDGDILEMNRQALDLLHGPKELAVIPDATHFFGEPGALDEVARRTTAWFERYLARPVVPPS